MDTLNRIAKAIIGAAEALSACTGAAAQEIRRMLEDLCRPIVSPWEKAEELQRKMEEELRALQAELLRADQARDREDSFWDFVRRLSRAAPVHPRVDPNYRVRSPRPRSRCQGTRCSLVWRSA